MIGRAPVCAAAFAVAAALPMRRTNVRTRLIRPPAGNGAHETGI